MPIFNLICNACGRKRRVVRAQGWKSTQEEVRCPECSTRMERDASASAQSAMVKETIDNGAMVKAVERFADGERLAKDRVQIEDALAKGKDPGRVIR
jgi:predicted nucleic acid-binding Zn ribbon protein